MVAPAVNICEAQTQGTELQMSRCVKVCRSVFGACYFLVCKCLDVHSDSLVAMVTCEPASTSIWGVRVRFFPLIGYVHTGIPLKDSAEVVGSNVPSLHPPLGTCLQGKGCYSIPGTATETKMTSPHPHQHLRLLKIFFYVATVQLILFRKVRLDGLSDVKTEVSLKSSHA